MISVTSKGVTLYVQILRPEFSTDLPETGAPRAPRSNQSLLVGLEICTQLCPLEDFQGRIVRYLEYKPQHKLTLKSTGDRPSSLQCFPVTLDVLKLPNYIPWDTKRDRWREILQNCSVISCLL